MKIFFDVDGVLIDGWHADVARRKPWDATIDDDLNVDREAFQRLFFEAPDDESSSRMFSCLTGQCDLKDALADVLPQVGFRGSVDDFMLYWFEKDSNVDKVVLQLVREIRERCGAQVFIASGQEHHRARYIWNELGLSKHFDDIFYSAAIGHAKSDVRFFAAINDTLGIGHQEQPLFFDDQPSIVELARRAGWDGTVFSSAADIRKHPRLQHLWTQREAPPIAGTAK